MFMMVLPERWVRFRTRMKVIVNGNVFRNSILVSILINTVMMGVEHYNQVGTCSLVFSMDCHPLYMAFTYLRLANNVNMILHCYLEYRFGQIMTST